MERSLKAECSLNHVAAAEPLIVTQQQTAGSIKLDGTALSRHFGRFASTSAALASSWPDTQGVAGDVCRSTAGWSLAAEADGPARMRLVAYWTQDASGRLSCAWTEQPVP